MPHKSSPLMRTWGTRFDTLPTSPVSPPAHEAPAPEDTSFASMTSSPTENIFKRKEDKMPHDASVFVGSLPSTVDQPELTRLLSEHLSEHIEVKNIKVVRDSKGGVCAFVQCEDAASAATLIHTLHSSPPKYFLGRTLRYEPARAFRTLLISYRTPMQYIPAHGADSQSMVGKDLQTVELDLPYAMRLWRPRNSKYLSLLYNAEAIDAEKHAGDNPSLTTENGSLFLQPVLFDAESIRTLAGFFGRLERFDSHEPPTRVDDNLFPHKNAENWSLHPAPHDAPRSPCMDTTCWEIKWDHRDDCVSALMTLRRVPHLTVTWAHQPPPFGSEQRSPYPGSPFLNSNVHYPLHVQVRPQPMRSQIAAFIDSSDTTDPSGNDENSNLGRPSFSETTSDVTNLSVDGAEEVSRPSVHAESSQKDGHLETNDALAITSRIEWSETDFPPLSDTRGERKAEYSVWNEKKPSQDESDRSPLLTSPHLDASAEDEMPAAFGELPMAPLEGNDEQELDMPPTPGLGKSPITPKTPGSQFPITPTSVVNDIQHLSFKEYEGKDNSYYNESNSGERELDPTTLFVGGLETFGPGAWDEEKVGKFFARFGGLESVKVVRPLNSHAAFAFVKFDNTESPARAVYEEHNRVYEGRAMRVQLRDCNPPRGSWRHGRGRGRFHQSHFGSQRRFLDHSDELQDTSAQRSSYDQNSSSVGTAPVTVSPVDIDANTALEGSDVTIATQGDEPTTDTQTHGPPTESRPTSPGPSATPSNMAPQSSYREWYDEPLSAVHTPPPSSFGSSVSAAISASAYPMGGGYYAPSQWIHPYAHQMQYSVPYFGYPGYPMSGQPIPVTIPQTFASPPGSDASGPATAAQSPWPSMSMYGSYIPYQTQVARAPGIDQSQPQHLNSRAPLVPTGFIQNEQGTLIAVYQPEALDQYMAGTHATPPPLPQPPIQSVPTWSQYPQPPYPYPGPPQAMVMPSRPQPSTQVGWAPNHGYAHQAPLTTPQLPVSHPSPAFRGGYNDIGRQTGTPHIRRQSTRRDQNTTYNLGRNNQTRTFHGRTSRGNINTSGYAANGETHARLTHFTQNSGEWNQRASGGR